MESRFPVSHSSGHARVEFAWFDAFRPQARRRVAQARRLCTQQQLEVAVCIASRGPNRSVTNMPHALPAMPALQKRAEQASLAFEKAAVAFNLGAVQVGWALHALQHKTRAAV